MHLRYNWYCSGKKQTRNKIYNVTYKTFAFFFHLQVLAIYTFTKRANLDDYENKQRKTVGFYTVSHFNVIHVDCHTAAVR